MNKLTILLVASIFASPVFAEEAKVEAPKQAEAVATEAAKAPEAAAEEVKKEEPVAAPEAKKEVKAEPAKKPAHNMKKHKKTTTYTVVPEKKYKVVPVK